MVGVVVGQKHVVEVGETDRLHKLALGSFAAVEEDPLAPAAYEQSRQAALRGRNRAAGAGEEDREIHGDESLSAEAHQLEAELAGLDVGDSHRRMRRSAALRRAAGIED